MSKARKGNVVELPGVKEDIPIHEYLDREMRRRGLSKTKLAEDLNIHRQTIYKILSGKRPISYNIAEKLSTRFPVKPEFWLNPTVRVSRPKLSDVVEVPTKQIWDADRSADNSIPEVQLASASAAPQILVDFQIKEALIDGGIKVDGYEESNIHAASLDLVIGSMTKTPVDELTRADYERVAPIELKPMEGVNVIAAEKIAFSRDYLARVGPIAAKAMRGLQLMHGFQIDPGYEGQMIFRVVNLGDQPCLLEVGSPIISLEIVKLSVTPDRVFKAEDSKRMHRIGNAIDDALYALVAPKQTNVGDYQITWPEAGLEVIHKSRSKAMDSALEIIYNVMAGAGGLAGYNIDLIRDTVSQKLSDLRMDKRDAEMLIDKADISNSDEVAAAVMQPYVGDLEALQSFKMVCAKAALDPLQVALAYIHARTWAEIKS